MPRDARCGHSLSFCAQGRPQPGHTTCSPGLRSCFLPAEIQAEAFLVLPRAPHSLCMFLIHVLSLSGSEVSEVCLGAGAAVNDTSDISKV